MDHNIIIISLERATERREAIKKEISKSHLENAIFLNAIDGSKLPQSMIGNITLPGGWRNGDKFQPGEVGCIMSHSNAIKLAKEKGWDHVIIFEDDITIAEDFNKRIKLLFKMLPNDWEHVYLSGTPKFQGYFFNKFPQVIPSPWTDCLHSYIIRNTAYDKILEKFEKKETTADDMIIDMYFRKKILKSYSFFPYVTHSNSSYSYIWNKSAGHNIKNESQNYFINKI
jgi:GR25 family glycosyltransferase involved in LPS biosynthesis